MSVQKLGLSGVLSQDEFLAFTWGTFSLASCFVAAKAYIRVTKVGRLSSDDYWIFFAWCTLLAYAGLTTSQIPAMWYMSRVGAGLIPVGEGLYEHGNFYVRRMFAVIGLFWTTTWAVKASLLALFWDLFGGSVVFRRWWYAVVFFSFGSYVGCWVASAMTCHPASTYFDFGQCNKDIDLKGAVISVSYSTSVDVLSDILIMLLPLPIILRMKISWKPKIGVLACFSLAIVTIVVALIRGIQIATTSAQDIVRLSIWTTTEACIALIVGCLPTFKALFTARVDRSRNRKSQYTDMRSPVGLSTDRSSRANFQRLSFKEEDISMTRVEVNRDQPSREIKDAESGETFELFMDPTRPPPLEIAVTKDFTVFSEYEYNSRGPSR